MTFADNLKRLPPVDGIEKLELLDSAGRVAATLENKPGKAGSLAVYNHLILVHRKIDAASAKEGLALFAEHTGDARANPGKHPNIDRLFEVIEKNLSFTGKATPK
ncbi:MAG TPA: DUF2322 family protein [Burkholderiales bacterium]|nr:DUF2322 family protein [Burkholderiales bacterium]